MSATVKQIRSTVKKAVPDFLVQLIGRRWELYRFFELSHEHGYRAQLRYAMADAGNRRRFDAWNQDVLAPQLGISSGLAVNVHDDARSMFEVYARNDPEEVEELQTFIALTGERKCLLDIGAHWGIFSLAFTGRPNSSAFAIEASPESYEVLCYHRQVNPHHNIKPFLLAAGDSSGKLRMENKQGYYEVLPPESSTVENVFEVDVVTIDGFVEQQRITPDALKIDVEGFELNVLRGGQRLLSQHRPLIFLEVHSRHLKSLGVSVKEVVDLLSALGYGLYEGNLKPIKNPASFLDRSTHRIVCSKEPLAKGSVNRV